MVHLFINSFKHRDPARNAELAEALKLNQSCGQIDRIHEITDPQRPTFRELCEIVRSRVGWADVAIIANSDIVFDESARLLHHIGYGECFALSRYEGERGERLCANPQGSQDAWVFRGWPPDIAVDFPLGTHGGDQRFAHMLGDAGYAVYNPSLSIKTRHLHSRVVVRTDEHSKGIGELRFTAPCRIEDIRHRAGDPIVRPGRIAIVQLGRLGDITNSLPIAFDLHREEHQIFWYVRPEFAPLLEGVSYVTPVIWNGSIDEPASAIEHALAGGYDRVLDIQVLNNPKPSPIKTGNYSSESWARAGYLDKYHLLPCVFDRAQSPAGDWKPPGSKPILAYCLDAHTARYADDLKRDLVAWLEKEFGSAFTLLPIGAPVWRPDALAAVLRECRALISVDSFPLHMSYAVGLPTIALTNQGWIGSEPRRNWIEHLTYSQTPFAEGRGKIAAALWAVLENRAKPNHLIYPAGNAPAGAYSQVRKLSILIPWIAPQEPLLRALLDRLAPQVLGHHEVEVLVEQHAGPAARRQKQNDMLARACGEYCCFMDPGDKIADGFVGLLIQALAANPDCVGFKVARYRNGKLDRVERHAADFDGEEFPIPKGADPAQPAFPPTPPEVPIGISPLCPVRTSIARKIGFDSGDEEYSRKLAESGLLHSEQYIDAIMCAKSI
jgi:hypothetical protein